MTLWILFSIHQETLIDISKGYVWNQLKKSVNGPSEKQTKKKNTKNIQTKENPQILKK